LGWEPVENWPAGWSRWLTPERDPAILVPDENDAGSLWQ